MKAHQQADFSEGGFEKIAPFLFVCLFLISLFVPRVSSTSLWGQNLRMGSSLGVRGKTCQSILVIRW